MKATTATIFLLSVCYCSSILAYPISPKPLRVLIEESDLIIVGYVQHVVEHKRKKKKMSFDSHEAIILVKEVLQGQYYANTISLSFEPYMVCPAPDRYDEGTYVLVFLTKSDVGKYQVNALSYGAKTLTLDEIEIFKTRITEMQVINKITNEDDRFSQTVEWLVKCAEHPSTRWDGTYELTPESDFMSFYSRKEIPAFKYLLNDAQILRLKSVLLSSSEQQYADFGLVDLIYPRFEQEILGYLRNKLSIMDEQSLWYTGENMKRILHSVTSVELENLYKQYVEIQFENKDEEIKKIISQFVRGLDDRIQQIGKN